MSDRVGKCSIVRCEDRSVGRILIMARKDGHGVHPVYASVCQKHLEGRKQVSRDGKPLVYGLRQWELTSL